MLSLFWHKNSFRESSQHIRELLRSNYLILVLAVSYIIISPFEAEAILPETPDSLQTSDSLEILAPWDVGIGLGNMIWIRLQESWELGGLGDSAITALADSIPRFFNRNVFLLRARLFSGVRYSWDQRGKLVEVPGYVRREVRTFFEPHGHNSGWYPLADITSGIRPKIGLGLFRHHGTMTTSLEGTIADHDKHSLQLRLSWEGLAGLYRRWQLHIAVSERQDDDMIFYGFGNDPVSDNRNAYIDPARHSSGNFMQRKIQFLTHFGVRSSDIMEWFFHTRLTEKYISDPSRTSKDKRLSAVFDLSSLPEAGEKRTSIYNEFMFRVDTRRSLLLTNSGFVSEYYLGYQQGIFNDDVQILRSGIDLGSTVSLAPGRCYLDTRLVLNSAQKVSGEENMAFYDYARHQSYRGVSSRHLLRTDGHTLVPSIENRWTIRDWLSTTVFTDFLLAGERLQSISIDNAPWTIGCGWIFHTAAEEIGRIELSYSEEDIRINADIGVPKNLNHRWRWR